MQMPFKQGRMVTCWCGLWVVPEQDGTCRYCGQKVVSDELQQQLPAGGRHTAGDPAGRLERCLRPSRETEGSFPGLAVPLPAVRGRA